MNSETTMNPLRVMRDQVYGERSTDRNWNNCEEHWEAEEEKRWLVITFNELPKPLKNHSDLPWPKTHTQ